MRAAPKRTNPTHTAMSCVLFIFIGPYAIAVDEPGDDEQQRQA